METGFEDFTDLENEVNEIIADSKKIFEVDPKDFVFSVEEKNDMRLEARKLADTISESFVNLGGVLYKVFASKAYEDFGFETFDEYCELDVGYQRRKCQYLMSIWNAMENKLTDESVKKRLKDLGWTKASRIAPHITDANAEEILKEVEGLGVSEVEEAMSIRRGKKNKKSSEERQGLDAEDVRQLSLDIIKPHYDNLKLAMDLAGEITGTQSKGQQLDLLATEFLTSNSTPGTAKSELVEVHLKGLKSLTGSSYEPSGAGDILVSLIDASLLNPEKLRSDIENPGNGDVTLKEFREFLDTEDVSPLFSKPEVKEFTEGDEEV